ncbi:MAG: hypothetical protein HY329_17055 [Chloroflexi bacterium]|nr:hypothetical protein [Chloroflexota bacterium]
MDQSPYNIRLATLEDVDELKANVRYTLASPEGKTPRKQFKDAVERREILVLEVLDPKDRTHKLAGFLEWHTRIDGTVTLKDAGSTGGGVQPTIIKRLIREMLNTYGPSVMRVKVRSDLEVWNSIFRELPGFEYEGREYTRPHFRSLYEYSGDRAAATPPRRFPPRPGVPGRRR